MFAGKCVVAWHVYDMFVHISIRVIGSTARKHQCPHAPTSSSFLCAQQYRCRALPETARHATSVGV